MQLGKIAVAVIFQQKEIDILMRNALEWIYLCRGKGQGSLHF